MKGRKALLMALLMAVLAGALCSPLSAAGKYMVLVRLTLQELVEDVNGMMERGWKPLGAVSRQTTEFGYDRWIQAMGEETPDSARERKL